MKKSSFNHLMVATAGFIQISISLYILFRISLHEIKYVVQASAPTRVKHNYIVVFVIFLYCLHLLLSGINLLKFRTHAARLATITNMFGLAVISLGCILWIGISAFSLIFCTVFLCGFIYFIYFLTRLETKKLFFLV